MTRSAQHGHPRPISHDADCAYNDEVEHSETSALLPTDLPPDIIPPKSFRRRVLLMCVLFLFIVEVSQFVREAPLQKIMEDIICRNYYADHLLRSPKIQDHRCKDNKVQETLAMVRGWTLAFELATPLVAQFPYGIIADKYGRRIVLFLAVFGYVLQTAWVMVVLFFPDTFNIWAMIPGSLFYLIGGGAAMASAMIWTIVADVVPVAERTSVFFQLTATILVISVIINPISAVLLKFDPWLAMWLSFGCLLLGMLSVGLIPETLTLRREADERHRRAQAVTSGDDDDARQREQDQETPDVKWRPLRSFKSFKEQILVQMWSTVANDMKHVWRFIFASKSVMILILATSAFLPIRLAMINILLQYMTKRFDWEWSTATLISNAGNLATLVSLLLFLPLGSLLLTRKYRYEPLQRDLLLSRISSVFIVLGMLSMAWAAAPWVFVTSLVIMSMGNGFNALCRALLNAIVEPHTLATLNTTIGLVEMLMALWSGPAMGWLLSRGMNLGGTWQGLPFLFLSFVALCMSGVVFVFRLPSGVAQAHAD